MSRYGYPPGAYNIEPMPSQPQLALCHGFFVQEGKRGQGLAHLLKGYQNAELEIQQYDYAICTVSQFNTAQQKVLAAAGWVKLTSFRNRRQAENTEIWGYTVIDKEPDYGLRK